MYARLCPRPAGRGEGQTVSGNPQREGWAKLSPTDKRKSSGKRNNWSLMQRDGEEHHWGRNTEFEGRLKCVLSILPAKTA